MILLQQFKNYLLSLKKKPSDVTIKNYVVDVAHFITWFETITDITFQPSDVTKEHIEAFKKAKQKELSQASIDRHISSLRKFFHFLKLESIISHDVFENESQQDKTNADPFALQQFKNYLYVYNSSRLTIKNYIIDVKQFLLWAKEVLQKPDTEVLLSLNPELITDYKNRLFTQGVFSASSINRKLSSLRKYTMWASSQGLMGNIIQEKAAPKSASLQQAIMAHISKDITIAPEAIKTASQPIISAPKTYSSFPPLRLGQKLMNLFDLILEAILITPTTNVLRHFHIFTWTLKGKPLFAKGKKLAHITNIAKEVYQPLLTKSAPWYTKLAFHIQYTRPNWYKRYRNTAVSQYFNLAVLVIFAVIIGVGLYAGFIAKPNKSAPLLAAGAAPLRILSFQGRLTDSNDNPITTGQNIRFIIYNSPTATGSAEVWEEVRGVTPDNDGIFSVLLGSNGNGGNANTCGTLPATGVCGIPQSLFANNPSLYLGVTIGNTPELTPRQQLATVAFATNAETLQGLPPITDTTNVTGNTNTVLALNSSGTLAIQGSATTTFQATSGQFILSGNTLTLNTVAGTNSNVQLSPDGTGIIDVQKPLQNTTNNNNIAAAQGGVEVDDNFAILATTSANAAFILNQNGSADLISASSGGVPKFTIGNAGQITSANYTTAGGIFYGTSTGTLGLSIAGSNGQCLVSNGAGAPTWGTCGSGSGNSWTESNGALFPTNITDDLLLGAGSTNSAKFAFTNVAFGTPVASISAQNAQGQALSLGANGSIQTYQNNTLTLGGSGTGNIFINPKGGSGTVTINGLGTGIVHSNSGVLSSSQVSLSSEVTGVLPLANGGTNNALTAVAGGIVYSDNSGLQITTAGSVGQCLTSNGSGTPGWTNCTLGGGTNFWTSTNGILYPINSTLDFAIGGVSSASAKFAILNVNSGTPVASVSAGTNGASYLTADGTLATTAFQSLTLGTSTTGNINIGTDTTGRNISIGNTTGSSAITLTAGSGNINFYNTNNKIDSSGNLSIAGNFNVNGTQRISSTGVGTFITGTTIGSQTFTTNNIADSGALTIATGTNGNLTLSPSGSGNTVLSSDFNTGVYIGSSSNTPAVLSVSGGIGSNGAFIINQTNSGDIIDASQSGNLKLQLTNTGSLNLIGGQASDIDTLTATSLNIGTSTTNAITIGKTATPLTLPSSTITLSGFGGGASNSNAVLYANGSNNLSQAVTTGTNLCLLSTGSGGNPVWGSCNAAGLDIFWQQSFGSLFPNNSTVDFLIGGTSSSSAKFAVLNVNNGTPTASVSAGTNGAAYLTAAGNLATTANQSLILGGSTTGNVFINPSNGSGFVGIDTNSPGATLDVNGNATVSGNLTLYGSGAKIIATTLNNALTIGGSGTGNISLQPLGGSGVVTDTGNLTVNGSSITFSTFTINGGLIYTNGTGNLGQTTAGSAGQCLISSGSGAPTWANCSTGGAGINYWTLTNGALYPINSTTDLFVGGTSTASAKFAVLNVNSGTPTASVSAGTNGAAYLTADGILATTALQSLTLGTTTTGNINIGTDATSRKITLGNTVAGTSFTIQANAASSIDTGVGNTLSFNTTNNGAITTGTGLTTLGGNLTINGTTQTIGNGANATIQTSGNSSLTVTAAGTGNLVLTSDFNTGVLIGSASNTIAPLSVSGGIGLNAAAIINQTNSGDIFTASASGVPEFTIANDGTIKNSLIPNQNNQYDLGTSALAWRNFFANNILLPITGGIGGYWTLQNGALFPTNQSNDVLLGSNATGSARIAFINIAGGTPTATISAGATGLALAGDGSIQSLRNGSLTVGGITTGNVIINPLNGTGLVGINTNSPGATLDVNGNATISGNLTLYGSSAKTIATTLNNGLTIGGASTGNISIQPLGGTGTLTDTGNLTINGSTIKLSAFTTNGGVLYTDATGALGQTATGGTGQCLTSVGGGTPIWQTCQTGTNSTNWWTLQNGALYPINATVDLFVGGTSTVSAKFAVLNVNSGTPVASVSAITNGAAYLTADGTLATTAKQTLNFGTSTTGNITIGTDATARTVTVGNTTAGSSFTIQGNATSSIDTGNNTLSLQTTNNGPINTGTGLTTLGGNLTVNGATVTLANASPTLTTSSNNNLSITAGTGTINLNTINNGAVTTGTGLTTLGGNLTVNGATTTFANAAPTITTGTNTNLTINPNGSGNTILASDFNTGVYIGSSSNTPAPLSVSGGIGNNGAFIVNQTNNGDIIDASQSGNLKLQLTNAGALNIVGGQSSDIDTLTATSLKIGASTTNGITIGKTATPLTLPSSTIALSAFGGGSSNSNAVLYANGSNNLAQAVTTNTNYCLLSNGSGGNPSWGPCTSSGIDNFWQQTNGALLPNNATVDFLIGGISTASAKFAVLNVIGSGTPTASVSAGTNGAAYVTADGTLATTAKQTLALGSSTTGNIGIGTDATARTVTIGNITSGSTFTIQANAGSSIDTGAGNTLSLNTTNNGPVTTGTGLTTVSGNLTVAGATTTFSNASPIITTGTNTNLTINPNGSGNTILASDFNTGVYVGSSSNTPAVLSVNGGIANNGAFIVNQTNNGDIIDASQSGNTKFQLNNSGDILLNGVTRITNAGAGTFISGTVIGTDTFTANTITDSGALTITTSGNNNLTLSAGTGTLNLNTVNNGAVTTGTGLTTVGGNLTVNGATTTLANASPTITTGTNTNLTVTPNGSGNTILTSDFNTGVYVGSSSNTPAPLSISGGIGNNGALIVNQTNSGDIIDASQSGNLKLQLTNTGSLNFVGGQTSDIDTLTATSLKIGASTTNGITIGKTATPLTLPSSTITLSAFGGGSSNSNAVLYANSSNNLAQAVTTSSNLCLLSNGSGGNPTWGPCTSSGIDLFWQQNSGALFPNNSTVDFLIGGQSSASAKFAVLNVAAGTPVASVSAGTNGAAYLTAAGNLATTANQPLILGGTTTGNVIINPLNGTGFVGINTNSPAATLDVNGNATVSGNLTLYGAGAKTIATTLNNGLTIGGASTGNIRLLPQNGSGTLTVSAATENNSATAINLTGASTIIDQNNGTLSINTTNNNPITTGTGLTTIGGSETINGSTLTLANASPTITTSSNNNLSITAGTGTINVNTANNGAVTTGTGLTTLGGNLTVNGATVTLANAAPIITTSSNNNLSITAGTGTINLNTANNGAVTTGTGLTTLGGNLTVNGATTTFANAAPTITTGTNTNLTITPNGSGNLVLSSDFNTGVYIGSSSNTPAVLSVNGGIANNGAFIVNQTNNGDIIDASQSGNLKLQLTNDGALNIVGGQASDIDTLTATSLKIGASTTNAITIGKTATPLTLPSSTITLSAFGGGSTNSNAILYANSSNNLAQAVTSANNLCLLSTGLNGNPVWGSCTSSGADLFWQQTNGALLPNNSSVDFLIGGQSSASAKFAVLNVNGPGTPTASVSAGTNGAAYLTAAGNLATTANQPLTFGGATTGTIILNPSNGTGLVGINTNSPAATLDVNGNATVSGNLTLYGGARTIATTLNNGLTIGGASTGNINITPLNGGAGSTLGLNAVNINLGATNPIIQATQTNSSLQLNANGGGLLTLQSGATGNIQFFSSSNTLTSGGTLTLAGNINLPNSNTISGVSNFVQVNAGLAVGGNTTYFINNTTSNLNALTLNGTLAVNQGGTAASKTSIDSSGNVLPGTDGGANIGSASLNWNVGYFKNLSLPINGGVDGYWTLNSNVLYPTNTPDDLAIGGTGTSSAKFQVFALANGPIPAGTATTSGQITFNTAGKINVLNGNSFNIYASSTGQGDAGLNLLLSLANNGSNLGLTTPAGASTDIQTISFNAGRGFVGYDGTTTGGSSASVFLGTNAGKSLELQTNGSTQANTRLFITATHGFVGIGTGTSTTNLGNTQLVVNQANDSGLGDIFTASAAGTPEFTIANDGTIKNSLIPNVDLTYNLGSSTLRWNNVFTGNLVLPITGGIDGYWTLSGNKLFPTNLSDDLLIGANATGSAVWQVFALGANAGTATSSGNLAFTGSTTKINQFNNGSINFQTSPGGDASLTSRLFIAGNGSIGIGTTTPLAQTGIDIERNGIVNSVLDINQLGSGDIFTASASGVTRLKLDNGGSLYASKFVDIDNPGGLYYLDPASTGVSLTTAGNVAVKLTTASTALQVGGDALIGYDANNFGVANYLDRRQILVQNSSGENPSGDSTAAITTISNYQERIVIDTATLISAGKMRSDCKDVRFTDEDGTTLLNYWREVGCNTSSTIFWVKIPTIPGGQAKRIYMYYNNASESSDVSSTTNTFVRELSGSQGVNAAWTFNNISSTVPDFSGNGNVATISGNVTQGVGNFYPTAGYFPGGSQDFVSVANAATLNSEDTAWGVWVNTTQSAANAVVMSKTDTSSAQNGIVIYINNGTPGCQIKGTGSTTTASSAGGTINDGNWHYILCTFIVNGGATNIFVDGVLQGTNASTIPAFTFSTQALQFGKANDRTTFPNSFVGRIAEARIYAGHLSSAMVTDLYGGGTGFGYVSLYNAGKEDVGYSAGRNVPLQYELQQEQNTTQTLPSFYVQNTTGNIGIGTNSISSSSARLTVNGDIKSGLYDATTWGSSFVNDQYRQRILIDNTASSAALTNYQVKVVVDTTGLISNGKMRSDCGDMRFSDNDGATSLNYWIQSQGTITTCNNGTGPNTTVWVKVPSIPANAKKYIYMYYGNPTATTTSSGSNTFNFFDDFTTFDTTNTWTATGSTSTGTHQLNITTGSVFSKTAAAVGNNTQPGFIVEASLLSVQNQTSNDFAGLAISNASSITANNGGSNKMAWVGIANGSNFLGAAGDGSTATYNITNAGTPTLFPLSTTNVLGIAVTPNQVIYYQNRSIASATSTYKGTWSAPQFIFLGDYKGSGSSTTDVTDTEWNWVIVRQYSATPPITTPDSEQDSSQVDPILYASNTQGRVGIGTANPYAVLDVVGNDNNLPANNGATIAQIEGIKNIATNLDNGYTGLNVIPQYNAGAGQSFFSITGIQSAPELTSNANVTSLISLEAAPDALGTGSITNLYAVQAAPLIGVGQTITNSYGVSSTLSNSGNITNAYGFYTQLSTGNVSGIINGYGLYVASPSGQFINHQFPIVTEPNAGNIGFGTTNPTQFLHLENSGGLSELINVNGSRGDSLLMLSRGNNGGGSNTGLDRSGIEFMTNQSLNWFAGVPYNNGIGVNEFTISQNDHINGVNPAFAINTSDQTMFGGGTPGSNNRVVVKAIAADDALAIEESGSTKKWAMTVFSDDSYRIGEQGVAYRFAINASTGKVGIGKIASDADSHLVQVNGTVESSGFNGPCISTAAFSTNSTSACNRDVAEVYSASEDVAPGDLLNISSTLDQGVAMTSIPYDPTALGIVTSQPGVLLGYTGDSVSMGGEANVYSTTSAAIRNPGVALVGRVPLKISTENGLIRRGDYLTSSSLPGVAMKATKAGRIIGLALEDFNQSQVTSQALPNGQHVSVSTIIAMNQPGWYDPDVYLTDTGNINITPTSNGAYQLLNSNDNNNVITRIGVFGQAVIGMLKTGSIDTQSITAHTLAIATNNITIAGQSLDNYIIGVVQNAMNNHTITSPLAEGDTIHSNVISPLATDSNISVSLTNSQLSIHNTNASTSAVVASIDNKGNATFSGTLNPKNLAVNNDATISGTLYAGKIVADNIVGLNAKLSTLSAQNITNINNIYFATPSGENSENNTASTGSGTILASNNSNELLGGFADVASYSAYLAYVPHLEATTATFDQGLMSLGSTSLSDTAIAGQLSIDGNLILAQNSINVLGATFDIQPLQQGDVHFEGGLIAIDTAGNLTVDGNAIFNKTLYAGVISPLANKDLTIRLGDSTQNSSNSALTIQNASGSGVFAINQLGDVIASGAATVNKLNLNIVQPALAVSDTEVIATGSAGQAQINIHQNAITIDDPLVTDKSLIYITPVGDTAGQTPFLQRQVSGTSFTVGVPTYTTQPVQFNWLIVN